VQLYGLCIGLLFGLGVGLCFGGFASLQHFVLRLLLYCNGSAPLNYVKFLVYAAERIFLRKVGSGYTLIHRLLQDYFAARHTEPRDATNQDAPGQVLINHKESRMDRLTSLLTALAAGAAAALQSTVAQVVKNSEAALKRVEPK
jgi:hypothetical protein